jgi:asparagine synthase (glutamine-hydrolysing)
MCGIAGLLDPTHSTPPDQLQGWAKAMAGTLVHRGPDDNGTWVDATVGIGFGHQRLSIVDPSLLGHQPMVSRDGRWVITYNGEIYNAPDLTRALVGSGVRLRGHCDTEVLVEAIAAWGL